MESSRVARSFSQGFHPYTGRPLEPQCPQDEPCASSPTSAHHEPSDGYSAYPAYQHGDRDRTADPRLALGPLSQAGSSLSQARSKLGQVRAGWTRTESDVRSAQSSAARSQTSIYPAENADEETDCSWAGQDAASNLTWADQTMRQLSYSSGNTNASWLLRELRGHLDDANSYLGQVKDEAVPTPWRASQVKQQLSNLPNQVYRIENVQGQIDQRLSSVSGPMQRAQSAIDTVSRGPGAQVKHSARDARYALTEVQQNLRDVELQVRWGDADLSQLENAISTAEAAVAQISQDCQYGYTSDRR